MNGRWLRTVVTLTLGSSVALTLASLAGCGEAATWGVLGVETCNGIDDDSNGTVDLEPSGAALKVDCSNRCGTGIMECVDGAWGSCSAPQPTEERCNGVDDNCDGVVDDGCDCVHGESRPCSSGLWGDCNDGVQVCDSGTWSECIAEGDPDTAPERCDLSENPDGDADVDVDGDGDGVDCLNDARRPCITGERGSDAYDGWQSCSAGEWSECNASEGFPEELCDGRDNDGDGEIDEMIECPFDVEIHEGHAYLFYADAATWHDALDVCKMLGYSLASVDDAEEDDFIRGSTLTRVFGYWWVGLNDLEEEGVFVWAGSGEPTTYTNWYDTEPNNAGSGEQCVVTCYAGGWADFGCDALFPFVCEAE